MPDDLTFDIVIIGGGAAGFFAALRAAELAGPNALRIIILEKALKPLGKVLISGGGRCNVTHACFDPSLLVTYYPRGSLALRGAFSRFQPADTIAWFERHGIPLKTEPDGRVFPVSDSSRSITGCLLDGAYMAGIKVETGTEVESIKHMPGKKDIYKFHITATNRKEQRSEPKIEINAHMVLLATGGDRNSFSLAASLGHTLEPPVPSLFSFRLNDSRLEDLAGLSVDPVKLTLEGDKTRQDKRSLLSSQEGPILITHWGLSGPAVLKLSSWGARWLYDRNYQATLKINWLHLLNQDEVIQKLAALKNKPTQGTLRVSTRSVFPQIPHRLWARIVASAGIPEAENWANISRVEMQRLSSELTQGVYSIQGKGPFKEEFVTCGGVKLEEINFKTMESRLLPGLFFAGEILDVDGLTGGFNFQNAWTTGWLAGNSMAIQSKEII